jgi:hypothetical protein
MSRIQTLTLLALLHSFALLPQDGARADWSETWGQIRKAAQSGQLIQVAKTRANDAGCTDARKLLDAIPLLAAAMDAGRYGDALKILAQFQTHLLCLNQESIVVVDFLLAFYSSDGVSKLGDKDEDRLLHALFQLGLLTFDQVTDTENSTWWMMVVGRKKQFWRSLDTYPEDFGIYTFNIEDSRLERLNAPGAHRLMMDAMLNSSELFQKKCYLGEMKDKSSLPQQAAGLADAAQTACGARGQADGKGSSKSGGGVVGEVGQFLGCVVDAAGNQGLRKQFHCVQKAVAGVTPQVSDLLKFPSVRLSGLPDRACMLSDEEDGGDSTASRNEKLGTAAVVLDKAAKLAKNLWDLVEIKHNHATTATGLSVGGDALIGIGMDLMSEDFVAAIHEATPGLIDKTFQVIYAGMLADNMEKALEMKAEWEKLPDVEAKKNWLIAYRETQLEKKKKQQQAAEGTADRKAFDDGFGGACSDRSGAAARAKESYACISGETELPDGNTTTGPPRPRIPTVGYSTDPDTTAPLNAAGNNWIPCSSQSGDQIRVNFALDVRCAAARCVEGEACACDRPNRPPGEASAALQAQMVRCRQLAYCAEGDCPCEPKPFSSTGGVKEVTPLDLPDSLPNGPIDLPDRSLQIPERKGPIPGQIP